MKPVYFILLLILIVNISVLAEIPNDKDLLLWIGEGSGARAIDATGNGNDGTFGGSAKWVAGQGKYDDGIVLRGKETYLEIPNVITETGSVVFWFKPDWDGKDDKDYRLFDASLGAIYFFIGKGSAHPDIAPPHFGIYFEAADDADWQDVDFDPTGIIKKGQWFHCAVTWDFTGGPPYVYIDGKERVKSRDITGGFPKLHEKPRFGWETVEYVAMNNGAEGIIDEISFWARALDVDDIQDLMGISQDVDAVEKLAISWGELKVIK